MIKQLIIKNFQGFTYTVFDFVDGLNIIKGENNTGKSALYRALQWCLENKAKRALSRIKNKRAGSEEEMSVEVIFEGGLSIKRIYLDSQKEKFQGYVLKVQETETFYNAIGNNVPEEIAELTKMSDLNFQTQHASFFLINETSGKVSKFLNDLMGLDQINKIMHQAKSVLFDTENSLNNSIKTLRKNEEEYKKLSFVPALEKRAKTLEIFVNDYEQMEVKLYSALDILGGIKKTVDLLKGDEEWLEVEFEFEKARELLVERDEKIRLLEAKGIIEKIKSIEESLQCNKSFIEIMGKGKREIGDALDQLGELSYKRTFVLDLIKEISQLGTSISGNEGKIKVLITQREELIKKAGLDLSFTVQDLQEFLNENKICPVCGTGLNK